MIATRGHFRFVGAAVWVAALCAICATATRAQTQRIHGLWVWKGPTVIEAAGGAEALRDFCMAQQINEVYVSVPVREDAATEASFARLIGLLHERRIRVQALISSTDADEPGPHRQRLLDHVHATVQFNRDHARQAFDGIHLDIEPQQRPENKGEGNLRFLANLVDAFREVRAMAEPAHLMVNADIQDKLLKGDAEQRRSLLTSLPEFTLMLYEVSKPSDGRSAEEQKAKIQATSKRYLRMAYEELDANAGAVGKMVIGLRTPDYLERLPAMLEAVDEANAADAHYGGWARHAYRDVVK